jgi:hypothetical protein
VNNQDGFFDNLPPSKNKGALSARVGRKPKVVTEMQAHKKQLRKEEKQAYIMKEVLRLR